METNMIRNSASDTDSEPHTLRSDPSSRGIPIHISSSHHRGSLSLLSNELQISQSPTIGFLTQEPKSQCEVSGLQASSMNANLQNETLPSGSVPVDTSDPSHTTIQTGSAASTFTEIKFTKKEMLANKGKSDEQATEQEIRLPSTEDPNISPCPPGNPSAGLIQVPSGGVSLPANSNPVGPLFSNIASSPPEFVTPSAAAFSSDVPSSVKFFSFVILHVPEDQEEAMRVCEILRSLDIGEGTTFCEGFETAGVSPLKCLEDAVENSAYIVLLLTTNFLSKWGEFQTNTVLMNSIEDKNKLGTIIPFYSRLKSPRGKIPLPIKSLIKLDENSPVFRTTVRNTFKRETIKRQHERWKREQDLKVLAERVEEAECLANDQQRMAMDYQALYSHLYAQMASMMSMLPPQMLPGQGQVININNAQNVQIGNQNSMNVQETTNVPQMELSGESYQECDDRVQS